MLQLLENAAAGKLDAVVVYKVDRWSRQLADMLSTIDLLDRHSVRFASVTEPIDTGTPIWAAGCCRCSGRSPSSSAA